MIKLINRQLFLTLLLIALIVADTSFSIADDVKGNVMSEVPECTAEDIKNEYATLCREIIPVSMLSELKQLELTNRFGYRVAKNSLLIVAKVAAEDIVFSDKPFFAGDIQGYLEKIDSDLFAIYLHFKDIDRSSLTLSLINVTGGEKPVIQYSGAHEFGQISLKRSADIIRELVSIGAEYQKVYFDKIPNLKPKEIEIVKGAHCKQSIYSCSVIYAADGESILTFVDNALTHKINIDNFVFVGIPNQSENRIQELLYGYDDKIFDAFMNFVTRVLVNAIENGEQPKFRFVGGFSNGGAWALDALNMYKDKFDGAIVMSPAEWEFKSDSNLKGKEIFIGSGLLERNLVKHTKSIASKLQELGATTHTLYPQSGHAMNSWVQIWNLALTEINSH